MSKLSYIKQLDGFRGLVAILIVLYHWPMSYLSVTIGGELLQWFYVMSGYLISRILFYDKSKNPTFGEFISRFYYRRSFRIFPLYFGYLLLGILVFLLSFKFRFLHHFADEVSRNWGYMFTYTYNYMGVGNFLMGKDYTSSHMFGHLWSLSLEEQFYIVYPFIVYFCSMRTLKWVVIVAIILGPISRGISFAVLQGWNPDDLQWAAVNAFRMGHTQIDSFAIGCLLAITGFKRIRHHMKALILILVLMGVVYAFNRWLVVYQGDTFEAIGGNRKLEVWFFHNYQHLYVFTVINFVAAFFFMAFERGFNVPWLLNNRFMAYLGKISYGVYVYHVPILAFWLIFYFKMMPFKPGEASPFLHKFLFELVAFAGYWILLFLVSHLSFKYFEEYFLIWKEKLDARKFARLHEGVVKKE